MAAMTPDRDTAPEADEPPLSSPRDVPGEFPLRRPSPFPRELLDDQAVFVVKRLQREGHEAYLVGGCVRDLMAGLEPKDFDVATDAPPNRIKRLFRSARVIGRRFRLVHIRFPGDHVIETSTFRGDPSRHIAPPDDERGDGRRPDWRSSAENVFGTAEEDANRRDFTVNALFYDPMRHEVIDWVGGLEDMERGVIRCIGDPATRIDEDPVRMLRAVHFAQRMDFALEQELEAAIARHADCLADASQARLYIELVKMLSRGCARDTFLCLHELGVLGVWLPELTAFLDEPIEWPAQAGGTHEEAQQGEPIDAPQGHATWNLLGAADRWGLGAHKAPESVALAVLFGPWIMRTWRQAPHGNGFHAFIDHVEAMFRPVALRMSIPRWASMQMRDILWMLDDLRKPPPPKRAKRLLRRPAFAAALAFLHLDLVARASPLRPEEHWLSLAEEARIDLELGKPPPRGRSRDAGKRSGQRGGARSTSGRRGRRGGRGGRKRREPQRRPLSEPEAGAWLDPPEL
jgi:tRNA nucleotidyltransferase/poly(A) polymerase